MIQGNPVELWAVSSKLDNGRSLNIGAIQHNPGQPMAVFGDGHDGGRVDVAPRDVNSREKSALLCECQDGIRGNVPTSAEVDGRETIVFCRERDDRGSGNVGIFETD